MKNEGSNTNLLYGSIYTKLHLLKFVHWIENIELEEALDLRKNSLICYNIKMLLSGKSSTHFDRSEFNENDYNAILKFTIHPKLFSTNNFFITKKNTIVLNRYLHMFFHEILLQRILIGISKSVQQKKSILNFMHELDIQEEIEYDSIKKANFRLRKSKNIGGFSRPKCPSTRSALYP